MSNPALKKEYVQQLCWEQLCWEQLCWRASGVPGIQQAECAEWFITALSKSGLGAFTGRVTANK